MSEPEFERYLEDVAARLRLPPHRKDEIREEFRAHLDEHWAAIAASGGERPQRIRQVLDDFGPSDRLAAAVARPYHRRAWRIVGLVAASLMMAFLLQMRLRGPGPAGSHGRWSTERTGPALAGGTLSFLGEVVGVLGGTPEVEAPGFEAFKFRLPAVSFEEEPLEDVLAHFREISGVNIWVNWAELQAVGIDGDTPVSMQLEDVSLGRLLDLLCAGIGEGGGLIAFGYGDNVIEISTPNTLRSPQPELGTVQAVYDVRAIIEAAVTRRMSSVREFSSAVKNSQFSWFADVETGIAKEIQGLIAESVAPDTWQLNGGPGSIEYFAGVLVVRAPAVTQARVADLVEQLGKQLAPQSGRASAGGAGRTPPAGSTMTDAPDMPASDSAGLFTAGTDEAKPPRKPAKAEKRPKHKGAAESGTRPEGDRDEDL